MKNEKFNFSVEYNFFLHELSIISPRKIQEKAYELLKTKTFGKDKNFNCLIVEPFFEEKIFMPQKTLLENVLNFIKSNSQKWIIFDILLMKEKTFVLPTFFYILLKYKKKSEGKHQEQKKNEQIKSQNPGLMEKDIVFGGKASKISLFFCGLIDKMDISHIFDIFVKKTPNFDFSSIPYDNLSQCYIPHIKNGQEKLSTTLFQIQVFSNCFLYFKNFSSLKYLGSSLLGENEEQSNQENPKKQSILEKKKIFSYSSFLDFRRTLVNNFRFFFLEQTEKIWKDIFLEIQDDSQSSIDIKNQDVSIQNKHIINQKLQDYRSRKLTDLFDILKAGLIDYYNRKQIPKEEKETEFQKEHKIHLQQKIIVQFSFFPKSLIFLSFFVSIMKFIKTKYIGEEKRAILFLIFDGDKYSDHQSEKHHDGKKNDEKFPLRDFEWFIEFCRINNFFELEKFFNYQKNNAIEELIILSYLNSNLNEKILTLISEYLLFLPYIDDEKLEFLSHLILLFCFFQ